MGINGAPRDLGGVLGKLEQRVGILERRGRGFSIPPVVPGAPSVASNEPPADAIVGTLWIDTDDGNKIYRWDGTGWLPTLDPSVDIERNRVSTLIASWQDSSASDDGLVVLYRQGAAPSSNLSVGDLWVKIPENKLYRWTGTAWADQADTELPAALSAAALSSTVADGRVRTWWQNSEPVPEGFGDLWVKKSDSPATLWRWNNFNWIQVLDWSLLLQQDQLDGKISTYYEPVPPSATAVGDIWYDTSDDNHPYRADATGSASWGAVSGSV